MLAAWYQGVARPVRVWSDWRTPASFVDIGPETAPPFYVEETQASPNGDLVAVNALEVWSMATAEMKFKMPGVDPVFASFSTDGRLGILDYLDEGSPVIRMVNAESGVDLQTINLDLPFEPVWLSFSPEVTRIAIADEFNLAVIDINTGSRAWHNDALSRVGPPLWVDSGDLLVVGGEGGLAVVDAASGHMVHELPGHRGGTFSYAGVPGTSLVASAGADDRETIIFDIGARPYEVGRLTSSISKIDYMGFMEGAADLWVIEGSDPQSGAIVNAATGETTAHFSGTELVHSSNGRFSAGLDTGGRSVLWSNADGREVFVAPDGWEVWGASDDGSLAVISGPSTRVVRTTDGTLVTELDAGVGVYDAIFSQDLRFVVTNNGGEMSYPGIRVFEVASGKLLGSIGSLGGLSSMITPDGRKLVVGGYNGEINVFDFAQLKAGVEEHEAIVRSIPAHESFILSATVSPDGLKIFSRAWGEPVKLWDLETGEALGEFGVMDHANQYPPAAAFHPTEPWLYATVGEGEIAIYTVDTDDLIEIARARLTRGLTEDECQLYLGRGCNQEP